MCMCSASCVRICERNICTSESICNTYFALKNWNYIYVNMSNFFSFWIICIIFFDFVLVFHVKYYVSKSRNSRMFQIRKDLRKSSSPTSCSKQDGHWNQTRLLRSLFSWVLKTFMNRDSTTSLDNLFFFFTLRKILSHFNLWPLCLVLLQCTSVKNLAPSSKVSEDCYKITLKLFLQAEQAQILQPLLTGQVLQGPDHLHGFVLNLLQCICNFLQHILWTRRAGEQDCFKSRLPVHPVWPLVLPGLGLFTIHFPTLCGCAYSHY